MIAGNKEIGNLGLGGGWGGVLAPSEFSPFSISLLTLFLPVHVYPSVNLLVDLLTIFSVVRMVFSSGVLSIYSFHGICRVTKTVARETCCMVISVCSH